MTQFDKSFINILPAQTNSIFCYFSFSASFIKEFEERNEVNSWTTSKTMLKLFYIENGVPIEKQAIITDGLTDNWYITLKDNDVDLFVEIGKLTKDNKYIPALTSNILSMPRNNQIDSTNIYMIDIINSNCSSCSNRAECDNSLPDNSIGNINELKRDCTRNDPESISKNNCINNYIYSAEILENDTKSKNYKKIEEFTNRKHWELSSSK